MYKRQLQVDIGGSGRIGGGGGDGGRGGHVYLRGNKQLWKLLHLKFKKHVKAEHGAHGSSNLKTGSQGKDVYIDVPLGTIVRDEESDEVLFEITEDVLIENFDLF